MISRSSFIHLSRWFAAMLVFISHLRSLMFKNFYQLPINKGKLTQLFYFTTSLGHQAVIIFFVLSGYLIIGSVLKQVKNGEFQFKNYLINRVSRLYAVLIVALLLTVILDHIGFKFDNIGIYTDKMHFYAMNFSVQDRSGLKFFLASLFMMQGIICVPLGSNAPLWSLNFEFFYYLIYPCFYIPFLNFVKKKNALYSLIYLLGGLLLIAILPRQLTIYFLLWLLGFIPIFLTIKSRLLSYLLPVLLLAFLCYQQTQIHKDASYLFYYDFIIGAIFSLWLSCFKEFDYKNKFYKVNEKLASFSYTLYLVHLPFIMCTLTITHFWFSIGISMVPSIAAFALFGGVLVLTYMFSYLVASFTEFKTNQFKKYIKFIFAVK